MPDKASPVSAQEPVCGPIAPRVPPQLAAAGRSWQDGGTAWRGEGLSAVLPRGHLRLRWQRGSTSDRLTAPLVRKLVRRGAHSGHDRSVPCTLEAGFMGLRPYC